ncbi:MAG: DUF3618 domain-containing protein [Actinomycetota bacterium]|nr:DUF3618 domain-containing protein [Actinomycetota bacterium]
MGPQPDEVEEIRREIDESRENLGEAVAALAYKADVKNRGKEAISDKKEQLMEKVETIKSKVSGDDEAGPGEKVKSRLPSREDVGEKMDTMKSKLPGDAAGRLGEKAPSKEDVKAKAQQAASATGDKPLAMAAGAAAAGLVAGLALPETDLEREKLGPPAQNARAQVRSAAQQAVAHAKQVAKDAAGSAADAARQAGQEQGGKFGEIAQNAAEKTREQVKPPNES